MLAVDGVSKRYGTRPALTDVTLAARRGEIVGLLGPNGAGKTTLLRIVGGILPADAGTVAVDGRPAGSLDARRLIGYMPETASLYPEMRVDAFVAYCARLRGVPGAEVRARVGEALERVGASALALRRCGSLSKGQRQAVGLAQAIVHDPPLLLLDEPSAGLDPVQSARLRSVLTGLAGTKAIVLSTHLLPDVRGLCARVVVLHSGRVLASGEPDEIAAGSAGLEAALLAMLERGDVHGEEAP